MRETPLSFHDQYRHEVAGLCRCACQDDRRGLQPAMSPEGQQPHTEHERRTEATSQHDVIESERVDQAPLRHRVKPTIRCIGRRRRSEEHTSELQSLMRISYAVFCLKKKTTTTAHNNN